MPKITEITHSLIIRHMQEWRIYNRYISAKLEVADIAKIENFSNLRGLNRRTVEPEPLVRVLVKVDGVTS